VLSRYSERLCTAFLLLHDLLRFVAYIPHEPRSRESLPSQALAFYVERNLRPRRLDDAARLALVVLARAIDWRWRRGRFGVSAIGLDNASPLEGCPRDRIKPNSGLGHNHVTLASLQRETAHSAVRAAFFEA
jgi:hypothetical protein